MAYLPIADAEVAPLAPVTSSLMTRIRDNIEYYIGLASDKVAGDIPMAGGSGTVAGGTVTDGTIVGTWTSAYNGEFRFDLTIADCSVTILRNGASVSGPHTTTTSVDIDGWSAGDTIVVSATVASGDTGTLTYEIGVSVASCALYGSTVSTNGASI